MGGAEGLEAQLSLARACTQPTTTIPPVNFSTVEAAEAAGFDAKLGRRSMPTESLADLSEADEVDNKVDDGVDDGVDDTGDDTADDSAADGVYDGLADGVADGVDRGKLKEVLAWYRSVPNLADSITCIAWQHRNTSPLVTVQGVAGAASVMISLLERSEWESDDIHGCAARFAQLDFRQDAHFFVWIAPGHLGTGDLGVADLRLEFPMPPEQMVAWVAANSCDNIQQYSCDNIDSRTDVSEAP